MTSEIRCWAVVVAAGSGSRMSLGGVPKQFRRLAGRPVLEWSMAAMAASGLIEQSVVVLPPGYQPHGAGDAVFVEGGATRTDSVAAGLSAVPSEVSHVLIHDAARPFVDVEVVRRVVEALRSGARAVVPVVPMVDTIRLTDGATVDRSDYVAVQTPQGFLRELVVRAHDAISSSNTSPAPTPTDDAQVVEAIGEEVVAVPGDPRNFKITTEDDWLNANALVSAGLHTPAGSDSRFEHAGIGVDAHRFGGPGPLWLGGLEIEGVEGLEGHSDADVVLHAVSDALLGAAALGDLGEHFPESEVAPGMSSRLILEKVVDLIDESGFEISNVDTTVIAARPRLTPYKRSIAHSLAGLLGLPTNSVGVKATTTDGMGLTGSGEGIGAVATVMLVKKA